MVSPSSDTPSHTGPGRAGWVSRSRCGISSSKFWPRPEIYERLLSTPSPTGLGCAEVAGCGDECGGCDELLGGGWVWEFWKGEGGGV